MVALQRRGYIDKDDEGTAQFRRRLSGIVSNS